MDTAQIIDILREGIYLVLKLTTPLLLTATGVGLIIALFQALTQVQEMTLTFVPKIIAIFLCLVVTLPFMASSMTVFAQNLYELIRVSGQPLTALPVP